MAFTGDLEQLNIVDVIQLIHTTRKSGTFSVKGSRGESKIIFSNGYIVGASHLNNRIRIGTVLVKSNAITLDDLKQALALQQKAGKGRQPLVTTLIEMGKLTQEAAFRGLKTLIEITIIELMSWSEGVFTFDVEAIAVSEQCSYLPGKMDQVMSLDAQMVLMDTLRIMDERERDIAAGKTIPTYEEQFEEVLPSAGAPSSASVGAVLTAKDLGLDELDHLEKKMPQQFSVTEIFDPREIYRQKTRELLSEFSVEEQDSLIDFLETIIDHGEKQKGQPRRDGQAKALILFCRDALITHLVMTMCKEDDVLVFTAEQESELEHIAEQCMTKKIMPVLVFDTPEYSEDGLTEDRIASIRLLLKDRHPLISMVQLASPREYTFMLQSYYDGVSAVFPKPERDIRRDTFISDMMRFLEAFHTYIDVHAQEALLTAEARLRELRDRMTALGTLEDYPDISFAILRFVSEFFPRSLALTVRPQDLLGEQSLGVFSERSQGPVPVASLNVPLAERSVFRDVVESGRFSYGESDDMIVKEHLWKEIGKPLRPAVLLLPIAVREKVVTVIYGDFGKKEVSPPQLEVLAMLAYQAGLVAENALCRKSGGKTVAG